MTNLLNKEIDTVNLPDDKGYFGEYGGSFVPEALQKVIDEVAAKYEEISQDPAFVQELADLNAHYTGRPSPVTFAVTQLEVRKSISRERTSTTQAPTRSTTVLERCCLQREWARRKSLPKPVLASTVLPLQPQLPSWDLNAISTWERSMS